MAGTWVKLIEQRQVSAVTLGIVSAIEQSFAADGARQTQAEIKRRFEICAKIFENLRGDMKWAVQRCLDHLPRYLRCELDGQPYDPKQDAKRVLWTPDTLGDPLT
jgi:hypothetical protein